jgi:hypothetical protein
VFTRSGRENLTANGRRPSYEGRQRKFGVDSEEEVRSQGDEAKLGRTRALDLWGKRNLNSTFQLKFQLNVSANFSAFQSLNFSGPNVLCLMYALYVCVMCM